MDDKALFDEVFGAFQSKYDGLEKRGTLVWYNGRIAFNTDGYNLLYNLTRLCNLLNEELL